MKIANILWIFVLFVSIISAYGYNYNMTINNSQLPFFDNITITLLSNITSNITAFSNSSFLSFLSNFTILNNTPYNFTINISIPNSTIPGNYTEYISILKIVDNRTTNLSFFFEILNLTFVNLTNQTNTTQNQTNNNISYFIRTDVNRFEWGRCQDALPFNDSLTIPITSNPNSTINISCDEWVHCPDSITTNSNGYANLTVNVSIPEIDTLGKYERKVKLNLNSTFNEIFLIFNIVYCERKFNFTGFEACRNITTFADWVSCNQQITEFLKKENRTITIVNETVKYINRTIYREVCSLSETSAKVFTRVEELQKNFVACQNQIAMKDERILELSELLRACQQDTEKYKADFANLSKKVLRDFSRQTTMIKIDYSTRLKKIIATIVKGLGVIALISVGIFLLKKYNSERLI